MTEDEATTCFMEALYLIKGAAEKFHDCGQDLCAIALLNLGEKIANDAVELCNEKMGLPKEHRPDITLN